MMLEQTGNVIDKLMDGDIDILAHGTNCSNGFGTGIAKEIAERLPIVKAKFHERAITTPGAIDPIFPWEFRHHIVMNCYTQYGYKVKDEDTRRYVSYDAVDDSMNLLAEFAATNGFTVGMPRIGSGRANGNWKVIKEIIRTNFKKHNAKVIVYTL